MTIVTRTDVTKAIKAERKSFEVAVSELCAMSAHVKEIKKFLAQRGYSISYLKQKSEEGHLVCKELMQYLPLYEFTTKDGKSTYKAIYRKGKDGNIVQKNWSIALVLQAMDNRLKEMTGTKNIAKAIEAYQADKTIAKAFDSAKKQAEKQAKKEEKKAEPIKKEEPKKTQSKAKNAKKDFTGVPEADAQKTNKKKSVSKAASIKAASKKSNKKAA